MMTEHRDVFVSGLNHVELIGGGCARFVCYTVDQEDGGDGCRRISLTFIVPIAALPDAIRKAIAAAGGSVASHAHDAMSALLH